MTFICHILCGVCVAMLVGENVVTNDYDSIFMQRSCEKLTLVKKSALVFSNLFVTVHLFLIFIGFCIHFAIFLKQRHLQSQQSEYSVVFNASGINFIRQRKQNFHFILWRFRRNVISPLGSFLSFLGSVVYNLLTYYFFLSITKSGPSVLGELVLFSVHCVHFFCLNFIETICSPTLFNSLIELIPWSRHRYRTVIVWGCIFWIKYGLNTKATTNRTRITWRAPFSSNASLQFDGKRCLITHIAQESTQSVPFQKCNLYLI